MSPKVTEVGPCPMLILVPSNNPEPDSPSDLWLEVPCLALAEFPEEGGLRCERGHEMGTLWEELRPGGNEWLREQQERYDY